MVQLTPFTSVAVCETDAAVFVLVIIVLIVIIINHNNVVIHCAGAAHILGKMEHGKISQGLWQLCAIQVEHLSQVRVHL